MPLPYTQYEHSASQYLTDQGVRAIDGRMVHQVSASELEPGDTILQDDQWYQLASVADHQGQMKVVSTTGIMWWINPFEKITVR